MGFKASSEGKGEQDRTNDGIPVDRTQAGLEDVLAQEDGLFHHHFQEGFLAAGERGKLRCVFMTEVFQVQIQSVCCCCRNPLGHGRKLWNCLCHWTWLGCHSWTFCGEGCCGAGPQPQEHGL